MSSLIWLYFEPVRDLILVTCKFGEDPLENGREKLKTPFSPLPVSKSFHSNQSSEGSASKQYVIYPLSQLHVCYISSFIQIGLLVLEYILLFQGAFGLYLAFNNRSVISRRVWIWQCLLFLECCLTEISRPRHLT